MDLGLELSFHVSRYSAVRSNVSTSETSFMFLFLALTQIFKDARQRVNLSAGLIHSISLIYASLRQPASFALSPVYGVEVTKS